jgi:uncharacterized protein (TIGR02757 family)
VICQYKLRDNLEQIYKSLNKREYVHPDPLEFLYEFENSEDREIVGLLASSLAYGRVAQILKSISKILTIIGKSPKAFLVSNTESQIFKALAGFKHRFTTDEEMCNFFVGIKNTINKYGTLNECFAHGLRNNNDYIEALCHFTSSIIPEACKNSLLPSPKKDSACKRLNLYLRWMVRTDEVDPGTWQDVDKKLLLVPVDTHMFNIARKLGLTTRKQANMKTVVEITKSFAEIEPQDPTKYDFVLTRLGIRSDMQIQPFINQCLS